MIHKNRVQFGRPAGRSCLSSGMPSTRQGGVDVAWSRRERPRAES